MILLKIQRRIHGTPLLVGVIRYTLHKGMNLHAEAVLIHIPRSIARYYFIIFFSKFYSPILKSNRLRFLMTPFRAAGATTNHLNDIDRRPLCEYIYTILGVFIRKNHLHKIWMHYTQSRHIKLVDGRRGI